MRSERGGIVIGWLARVVLGLLVLGLVAFEAGAVIVAKVSVDSAADAAAIEASAEYARTRNAEGACEEASKKAAQGGARVTNCVVSSDGQFVSVTAEKIARTWIIQRLGSLKNHRIATATHRVKVT